MLELDKLDLTEPVSSRRSDWLRMHTGSFSSDAFHPFSFFFFFKFHKRQEKDLLDQKKEKEETLLLEMVSVTLHLHSAETPPFFSGQHHLCAQEHLERQQNDEKMNSKKHADRKRELTSPFLSSLFNEEFVKKKNEKEKFSITMCVFDRKRQQDLSVNIQVHVHVLFWSYSVLR